MSWPWSQLGLPGPCDLSQVRRAYAEKLKTTHPEDDPEGFQRLHSAYQLASRMARQQERQRKARPAPPPESPPQESPPPGAGDFDFDDLLQGGGPSPRRRQEEQDFDFEELLQEGGPSPHRGQEEQDFDFEELLQEGGPSPRRRQEKEQDFDFERLFAEGEAERAEARRRRAQARRSAQERERQERIRQEEARRNSYEQQRQFQFRQEQARWQSTETILHTIEMMYQSRAEEKSWRTFFQSPLFQQNKGSMDLIFGLEDFVSTRGDLPDKVRVALYLAYGFDKEVSRPELRPLYQMLLPAWKAEQGERRRQRMYNLFGGLGGVAGVVVIGMIVTSNYLPGFIILGALAVYGLTKGWFKREAKNLNSPKKTNWYRVCFAAGIVIAAVLMIVRLPGVWDRVEVMMPASDPREQTCRYLEQDYGERFRSLYNKNAPDERFSNVFSLWNETSKRFLAGPDGERDKNSGKLGYTTNYPEMMVLWALEDFARERGIYTVDDVDDEGGLESWDTTGTYLIALDFYGDGETVTQLGELLEELSREDWYQVRPPQFEVILCSGMLANGRLMLHRYSSGEGTFDAQAVREEYEEFFAHAYCAQLLQDQELDRDFVHDGKELYTLVSGGMAEMKGEECCKLCGLDGSGQVAMEYYVSTTGGTVYCVPGGFWANGGTEEDVQFYRLIHVDATGGMFHLFYPWITRVS